MKEFAFKMQLIVLEEMFPQIVNKNGGVAVNKEIAEFNNGTKLYYRNNGLWSIEARSYNDIQEAIAEVLKFKTELRCKK